MLRAASERRQRPSARARAAALACAITVSVLAVGVSASFAQIQAPPPPDPGTPTPVDPQDPEQPGDEPSGGEDRPPSKAGPSKLNPFPVVVIAGRQGERATRVTELLVRGPNDALVVLRCLGSDCPMRRIARDIPRTKRVRLRRAERVYPVGTSIEIRVTAKNRIGKYTKVRFRPGRTPSRTDSCLQPGATDPSACPD